MLLGIDFGTTRTVVASVDRGNYPIVNFELENGDTRDWYPSLIAARGKELLFGFDAALKTGEPGWQILRSFKTKLSSVGPDEEVDLGELQPTGLELMTGFLRRLSEDLVNRSNLRLKSREKLEAVVSVPANANSNQRFITLEAFRRAGFEVRTMINEPSAAGIEYAHHIATAGGVSKREALVVYDLGGGTFDSSVIGLNERNHEVLGSEGLNQLGGDNFDFILLEMALKAANIHDVPQDAFAPLIDECRRRKEDLHPNTRRITVDLGLGIDGAGETTVNVSDFYDACRPLVDQTIEAMEQVMEKAARITGYDLHDSSAVYLVGGSSDLPLVARMLRERYGRQVKRSPYPHAATAIGLAIVADTEAGYKLRERFTRHFGVWREQDGGRAVTFDVLFEKDTPLPAKGEPTLVRIRQYDPTHNIGDFRYLECNRLDPTGQPQGDMAPWDEILFPFDPSMRSAEKLNKFPVTRGHQFGAVVEEIYSCDSSGIIEVEIADVTNQFSRRYRLRGKRN